MPIAFLAEKKSRSKDTTANKIYVKWDTPNCGGLSIHGTSKCFENEQEDGKNDGCKCVNPPEFDCTLYFKLGISARKHKPYLKSGCKWTEWGPLVCSEYPDSFPSLNSETVKKRFKYALKYTADAMNLSDQTAGVETHPEVTPFFKLFMGIYSEIEKDELEGKVGAMITGAKNDSMLTFESNILPSPLNRSISGVLSASLSSRRSSTPSSNKDLSPNSENEINSQADFQDDSDFIFEEAEGGDKLLSAEDSEEATKAAVSRASNSSLKAKLAKGVDKVSTVVIY